MTIRCTVLKTAYCGIRVTLDYKYIYNYKLVDHESTQGKEKGKSLAARRGTQNGTKEEVKKTKKRRVSNSSEHETWPCVKLRRAKRMHFSCIAIGYFISVFVYQKI